LEDALLRAAERNQYADEAQMESDFLSLKEYAANDTAMHDWFQRRAPAGTWPPQEKRNTAAGSSR